MSLPPPQKKTPTVKTTSSAWGRRTRAIWKAEAVPKFNLDWGARYNLPGITLLKLSYSYQGG